MMHLDQHQRRHLRRLGHDLKPIVRTGAAGLSDAVLRELDIALRDHELVKVKLVADDRTQRQEFVHRICAETDAVAVQTVGHVALFYRPNPRARHPIELPGAS